MNAQNLDKLSDAEKSLIAYAFKYLVIEWSTCYMLEVELDAPYSHILHGGPGLVVHGGNGSKAYAHHLGDPDWAVVHIDDEDWKAQDLEALLLEGLKRVAEHDLTEET